ncbi:MAG: hypothetical protein IIA40_14375 [SAR324 cluster bacterium]|nr:hypothetical protein [SAR324 cluster bacterium]
MSADKEPAFGGQPYPVRTVTVSIHSADLIHDEKVAETADLQVASSPGAFVRWRPVIV